MKSFTVSRLPHLHFGPGMIRRVASILRDRGAANVVVVTGGSSFQESQHYQDLRTSLSEGGIDPAVFSVVGEPQPVLVDELKREIGRTPVDAVIAIGGGSVIDAGKALSAALHLSGSIRDYLEGVGTKSPTGEKTFFIAVPTTSGTGSEATKNAVLSEVSEHGFKKSLRHDNYVPDVAIVDPSLVVSCPQSVTARSGMDAITQLLEAFTSTEASPFTDALAESGLAAAGRSFLSAYQDGDDAAAREDMAYAAYLSGVCLANAGLGVVHGIASPAGAVTTIPHGGVCGTLIAEATRYTIEKLRAESNTRESEAIRKYGRAAVLLTGEDRSDVESNLKALVDRLRELQDETRIPTLGEYGLTRERIAAVAARSGTKNHPVDLDKDEIRVIIEARL
jgi:alcohol dehydrogenase class IV